MDDMTICGKYEKVSVPFRGLLIPNLTTVIFYDSLKLVSVPFRGLLIPNDMEINERIRFLSFRPLPGSPYS